MDFLKRLATVPIEFGHVNGNRFIIVDFRGRKEMVSEIELQCLSFIACTEFECDDLIIIEDSSQADTKIRIIGKDGREAEYCGNGALYLSIKIGSELRKNTLTLETFSGLRKAEKHGNQWAVEIGAVKYLFHDINQPDISRSYKGLITGLIQIGEPHCIIQAPEWLTLKTSSDEFNAFCLPLCEAFNYPGGVNVTMVFAQEETAAWIRIFERGVRRETASCGTGAVAIASFLPALKDPNTTYTIFSPGGYHNVYNKNFSWYIESTSHCTFHGSLGSIIAKTVDQTFTASAVG